MIITKASSHHGKQKQGGRAHTQQPQGGTAAALSSLEGTGQASRTSAAAVLIAHSLCSLLPAATHYHHLFIP